MTNEEKRVLNLEVLATAFREILGVNENYGDKKSTAYNYIKDLARQGLKTSQKAIKESE